MFSTLKTAVAATTAAAFTLAAGAGAAVAGPLKNPAAAPEFSGIDKWLNSEPLTVQQLRGKVVLVDFWTYTCINCINVLPHVKAWYDKYKDKGLVVVGVHTPEFPFERSTVNVQTALKRFDIRYPVAQDNRYATWTAYRNQYWPALYLVDRKGQVVYTHFGEGQYSQTEAAIQALLAAKD
ncbi:thioredoxin family protein [Pseudoduganella sp. LjRoot289]|uniref:thioredoxin family protein n=1 Tax=Pseudoduganella sp. LjRoot289 TaxID=3342314 RepID=UPI003ED130B6